MPRKRLKLRNPRSLEVRKAYEKILERDLAAELLKASLEGAGILGPPKDYATFQFSRFTG